MIALAYEISYVLHAKNCFYIHDLQPKWNDLDVNQHVNNVKYIGWILEVTNPDGFSYFINL